MRFSGRRSRIAVLGQPLGRTIDLIDYVEGVRGQVTGAPGDQQFRVYVALEPGAREIVDNAKEFRRTADNAFFHQGYPISYRQDGYPSIQISMSRDAARADIDIDYRSSRFPIALVNGHLSASNSDVRAGNLDRHNGRWSGLVNWWDGLIGSLFAAEVEVPEDAPQAFPAMPRAGSKTIDVAVDDFLTSWLVEGRPNLAVAYVDPAAYDCLAQRLEKDGQAIDRGLASLQLFARMKRINDVVGPRTSLAGTTRPRRLPDPALRVVDHKRQDQYAIYGVPRALAEQMSCASRTSFGDVPPAPVTRDRREVYENFYSTVAIDRPDRAGAALGLLWQRRDGIWKIVSYQAIWEDAPDAVALPDLIKPVAPVAESRVTAEPSLLQANQRFLDAWLVRKNYDQAVDGHRARCGRVRQSLPGSRGAATDERRRAVCSTEGRAGAREPAGWHRRPAGRRDRAGRADRSTPAHRRPAANQGVSRAGRAGLDGAHPGVRRAAGTWRHGGHRRRRRARLRPVLPFRVSIPERGPSRRSARTRLDPPDRCLAHLLVQDHRALRSRPQLPFQVVRP